MATPTKHGRHQVFKTLTNPQDEFARPKEMS